MLVRVLPNRTIFATRKSRRLTRSPVQLARVEQVYGHIGRTAGKRPAQRLLHDRVGRVVVRRKDVAGNTLERPAHLEVDLRDCVGGEACELRQERQGYMTVPSAGVVDNDVAGVGHLSPGARASLHRERVLQPRTESDIDAMPVLGLLSERACPGDVVIDLPKPRRRDIVKILDDVPAAAR